MLFLFFVGWKSNHFYDKKTTTVNALFVRLLFIYFWTGKYSWVIGFNLPITSFVSRLAHYILVVRIASAPQSRSRVIRKKPMTWVYRVDGTNCTVMSSRRVYCSSAAPSAARPTPLRDPQIKFTLKKFSVTPFSLAFRSWQTCGTNTRKKPANQSGGDIWMNPFRGKLFPAGGSVWSG